MDKTTTLNLRINPIVKTRAENVLNQLGISMSTAIDIYLNQIYLRGGIPFAVTLPEAPLSVNMDYMSEKEIHTELSYGLEQAKVDMVADAAETFDNFKRNHK